MRCQKCGTKLREAYPSPLGEQLCAGCHDQVVGAVVGVETGSLGTAIAMAGSDAARPNGVLAWIRSALRRTRG